MIEIKKDNGTFRFALKTSEGNTLLNSVDFESEEEVRRTVESLNPLIQHHSVFERKTDHNGKFLFRLNDGNGKTIGSSELYGSEVGMENGIKNLKNRIAAIGNANVIKR